MIVSHSRKFVFMRGTHNAGTTVKAALSTLCDDSDRIGQYNPAQIPELEAAGYRIEQHNMASSGRRLVSFTSHWDLEDLYKTYPKYAEYDVIGMCRNPYEKAYSFAKFIIMANRYKNQLDPVEATPEMVREFLRAYLQKAYIKKDGLCSHYFVYNQQTTGKVTVIRYENLESDLKRVFARYDAEMPPLFHFKDTSKVLDMKWQNVLTQPEISLVNEVMEKDFEIFGYEMV